MTDGVSSLFTYDKGDVRQQLNEQSLNSLKGAYIGECIGDYYKGYQGGYQEFRQYVKCCSGRLGDLGFGV